MITPYTFAPSGWAFCNGQLLLIADNAALFDLLGTIFGGDGESTFGLPNLQARVPLGTGSGAGLTSRTLADNGGADYVTLIQSELPSHRHSLQANSSDGSSNNPAGLVFASNAENDQVFGASGESALGANTLSAAGGSQSHNNMPPYEVLNVCIATAGNFNSVTDPYVGEIKLYAETQHIFLPAAPGQSATARCSALQIMKRSTLFLAQRTVETEKTILLSPIFGGAFRSVPDRDPDCRTGLLVKPGGKKP